MATETDNQAETTKGRASGLVGRIVIRPGDEVLFAGLVWIVEEIDEPLELIKIRQKARPANSQQLRAERVVAV